jgi:hypothetical protein
VIFIDGAIKSGIFGVDFAGALIYGNEWFGMRIEDRKRT